MFPRNYKYLLNTTLICNTTHMYIYISRWREREKEIVELAKQFKNECRLSKRIARDKKRANERRESDTSAQSDVRLGKRRLQQRDAYASFSMERRHARIESVSNARHQRIAAQSSKERDARLQQLRTAREQTIATESTEERQTRLQQLRSAQQQRIATTPPEEREARLQQLRTAQQQDCCRINRGERPRLKQLRTAKHFQVYMNVRSVSTCSTQSECRCTRDKHSPKLHSSANNINPGVVPPQLMVPFYTSAILLLYYGLSLYLRSSAFCNLGSNTSRRDACLGCDVNHFHLPAATRSV